MDDKKEVEVKPVDPYEKYKSFKWNNEGELKNGPISDDKRQCRDLFCCLIFVLFFMGWIVVAYLGFTKGNPNLMWYPYDDDGNQCGRGDLKEYPFLYFYSVVTNLKDGELTGATSCYCLKECPTKEFTDASYTKTNNMIELQCKPTAKSGDCKINEANFYRSKGVMNRFCFPIGGEEITYDRYTDANGKEYIEIAAYENAAGKWINLTAGKDKLVSWMIDLVTCWPVILGSLGCSFIIAFLYLFFVRYCAAFIIYTTIFLVEAGFIAIGYFFWIRKDIYQSVDDAIYHDAMLGLAWFCFICAFIWFVFICFMCNKIRLAVALLEATAKYIHNNCCILFVPFLFFFLTGGFYCYWIFLSIYLYSTGNVAQDSKIIADIQWDDQTRYAWWYNLFALFYWNEFLKALAQFVYASSACIWYFTHEKGTDETPIRSSFKRAFRYHWGSLAFGALIMAVIRFMMLLLEHIKRKIDRTLGKNSKSGKIYRCVISCCQCCMSCVARVMEFINRHAYIQIALKGESFCTSAWEGFGLIIRNLGRFSALTALGSFFNLFGMIFIATSTGLTGYLLITNIKMFSDDLNSPILPTFCMVMIGFVIGYICMSVFGTSSDALMHSFLWDEELNKGQPKSYPELQKFMADERVVKDKQQIPEIK